MPLEGEGIIFVPFSREGMLLAPVEGKGYKEGAF